MLESINGKSIQIPKPIKMGLHWFNLKTPKETQNSKTQQNLMG